MSVSFHSQCSYLLPLDCGVPQGSVLGPLSFVLYLSDVTPRVQAHNLSIHLYADDVLIYGTCNIRLKYRFFLSCFSICLDEVISWFSSLRLLLNEEKTKFLWCASRHRKSLIPEDSIRVGSIFVAPSNSVRCLGVHFDNHLSFNVHISCCVSSCFAVLRQVRSIRRCLDHSTLTSVVSSLVISRLEYCMSLLYGLPNVQHKRLQSVLNACARVIFFTSRFSSISPLLRKLHFLPIDKMIE